METKWILNLQIKSVNYWGTLCIWGVKSILLDLIVCPGCFVIKPLEQCQIELKPFILFFEIRSFFVKVVCIKDFFWFFFLH